MGGEVCLFSGRILAYALFTMVIFNQLAATQLIDISPPLFLITTRKRQIVGIVSLEFGGGLAID